MDAAPGAAPAAPSSPPRRSEPGCGSYALFAALGAWILGASVALQAGAWFGEQLTLIFGIVMPPIIWLPVSWGHALLAGGPAAVMAALSRHARLRSAYLAWTAGAAFVALAALGRIFPLTWNQPTAIAQTALAMMFATGVALVLARRRRLNRRDAQESWESRETMGDAVIGRPGEGGFVDGAADASNTGRGGRPAARAMGLAAGLAPVIVLPLVVWGALGSPLDTFVHALAGVALGVVAGLLFEGWVFAPGERAEATPASGRLMNRDGRGRLVLEAFAAAVLLTMLGSGYGAGGSQLLLLVMLPPLGLAAAGVARAAHRQGAAAWPALAALVGLTAAAALTLIDPDEMMLILGANELLSWAMRAAALSVFLALAAGAAATAIGRRPGAQRAPASGLGLAGLIWALVLVVYLVAGQPGFYGERLFVVFRQQADLSLAPAIADRDERAAYVYATLVAHADSSQAGVRGVLDRLNVAYQPYYLMSAIEVGGGPLLRTYLELQPEVDRVLDSPQLRPLPQLPPEGRGSTAPPTGPEWNISAIGADRVWNELGITGQGIVVGQSDSGVQAEHPALRDAYRGRDDGDDYNWLDAWFATSSPTDISGHGTHTLGTILGQGGIGVAPGAEWFGCANLARNLANPALYLDCMQFMLAPFPQAGDPLRDGDPARAAHVINNSWGCPPLEGCDPPSLEPAVQALRAAGIFVVASAGNEGPTCGSVRAPPALYDAAFSVGAVDRHGNLVDFSSRGPVTADDSRRLKPDISAPGHEVVSALPGSTYGPNSGTSMAGPHVAGTVALMWSANPGLVGDIERTEALLRETARPFAGSLTVTDPACGGGPLPNNAVGYGLLDAYAAVRAALDED
jgi:subtilisin family serine protease